MKSRKSYLKIGLSFVLNKIRSNEMTTGAILSVIVGVIAGFGAIAFRWLISSFQSLFFGGGADILGFLGQYYIILTDITANTTNNSIRVKPLLSVSALTSVVDFCFILLPISMNMKTILTLLLKLLEFFLCSINKPIIPLR